LFFFYFLDLFYFSISLFIILFYLIFYTRFTPIFFNCYFYYYYYFFLISSLNFFYAVNAVILSYQKVISLCQSTETYAVKVNDFKKSELGIYKIYEDDFLEDKFLFFDFVDVVSYSYEQKLSFHSYSSIEMILAFDYLSILSAFLCLFCPLQAKSMKIWIQYLKFLHSFEFLANKNWASFSFYQSIYMDNFFCYLLLIITCK
jgi:hypothetical protein